MPPWRQKASSWSDTSQAGRLSGSERRLQLRQFRPRLPGTASVPRQLPRPELLQRRRSAPAAAACVGAVPRRAGRRVRLRQADVHVGRAAAGRLDCGPQGVPEVVSKERFRGVRIFDIRHRESEADRGRADVPWIAHPHAGRRSRRQGQHLRVRVGHERRPIRRRARRVLGRCARRGQGHRALQHRCDPGAAQGAGDREDRESAAHLCGSGDRCHRTACGWAAATAKARRSRASRTSATTSRRIRRWAWPPARARATASCWTFPIP